MLWRNIIGYHELEQGDSNLVWDIRESLQAWHLRGELKKEWELAGQSNEEIE